MEIDEPCSKIRGVTAGKSQPTGVSEVTPNPSLKRLKASNAAHPFSTLIGTSPVDRHRADMVTFSMTKYIALLRAVNVGGTGKLSMTELKAMCLEAGFDHVETYIASGNIVFETKASSAKVKSELEERLLAYAGKPVGVLVRTPSEMKAILDGNPFPKHPPNFTVAIFLDEKPPSDALEHALGKADEEMRLGEREIYVHFGAGMGRSKLKIPAAKHGTARNMNTIAKLVSMSLES